MKHAISSEPQFQELDAPVYTLKECHDMLSVMTNVMTDFYNHDTSLSDVEEYIDRFPFIRKETREHILSIVATHMSNE